MTKFDVGFHCDGDCEKCGLYCPGLEEVFSPDELYGEDIYDEI